MDKNMQVNLSVIDVERKYAYDYEEKVYGDNSIVSYGKENNLPTLYYNCYTESATLKAVIDSSVNYILGEEVIVNDCAASWKQEVNPSGMSMRQFLANLALSYQIYGGFAFQVIYSKLNTVAALYPLDFKKCRTNEKGTKIFYNKKGWSRYSTKSEVFDRFNREKIAPNKLTQIFYFKGDFTNTIYPVPSWKGALNDVLTEIECGRYSLNSVSSGFSAKYILNIPDKSNLTDEQKELIEKKIKEKFCGADTDSNFMLYYYGDKESQMNIAKIEADNAPEQFINIKDNARSNIYTAFRVTPNLLGLPTATTGFNSQEYSSAFKLYQKTVIAPIQRVLVETMDKILGTADAIKIKEFRIEFEEE